MGGGGQKYVSIWGGISDGTFWQPLDFLGESPNPPDPLPPYTPIGGALWGGARGGTHEGAGIMSLTPKCDMFLESP